MVVLIDSGAIIALFRADDAWHTRMKDWAASSRATWLVPVTVLQEAATFLGRAFGPAAEATLLRSAVNGDLALEQLDPSDVARAAGLVETYADFPIGFVDASIVAIAERLDIREVLTTDRRHFGAIRPAHCPSLRLLP